MSLLAPISCHRPTSDRYATSASESSGRSQYHDRSVVDESDGADPHGLGHGEFVGQSEEADDDAEYGPNLELTVIQTCTCRIVTDVKNLWASSGHASLTTIECACVDGALVIRGTVSSYYYKQLAQECVRGVQGIQQIVNELTVSEWDEKSTHHRDDVKPNK